MKLSAEENGEFMELPEETDDTVMLSTLQSQLGCGTVVSRVRGGR